MRLPLGFYEERSRFPLFCKIVFPSLKQKIMQKPSV